MDASQPQDWLIQQIPSLDQCQMIVVPRSCVVWKKPDILLRVQDLETYVEDEGSVEVLNGVLHAQDQNSDPEIVLLDECDFPLRQVIHAPKVALRSWAELEQRSSTHHVLLSRINGDADEKYLIPKLEHTIAAVLMYLEKSRAPTGPPYKSLTFGLIKDNGIVPVAKTVKGLNEDLLEWLLEFAANNTIERFGPVQVLAQKAVFELSYTKIVQAKRTKAGVKIMDACIGNRYEDVSSIQVGSIDELIDS